MIADLIGPESMQKLADAYGGQRRYVARNPTKLGWLTLVLEPDEVDRIWQEFRGCQILVPRRKVVGYCKQGGRNRGATELKRDRNVAIYELSFEMSRSDLARIFGLQLREIHRIIKRVSQPATKAQ